MTKEDVKKYETAAALNGRGYKAAGKTGSAEYDEYGSSHSWFDGYCENADIFLIIGTSLNVYPAAGLLNYVPAHVPVYLIDPNDVPIASGRKVHVIQKGASDGMEELMHLLTAEQ